ncbi:MAG: PhnD/SsuA/transferrin family substrate-binding protein [Geminicoccaceae bacterium]|nr:PhnD/SsuA/transferrin family substrate-binding protein [Geminicoccaceae bacterium]
MRHTMARNCWLALLLVVAAVLCPRGLMAAEFPPDDGMRELTLATVSPEVSAVEAQMEPILAAANRILAADNIRLELRVFGTYTSLVWQMWDEGVDLIIDQTLMALNIMRDTSSRPLGAVTRPGGALTRSIIVVLADSDIRTLKDLVGRRLAFSRPASSFGHMLPRISLGLDRYGLVETHAGVPDGSHPDAISMVFTQGSLSPIIWLHKGRVDAAAVPENMLDHFEWNRPGRFRRIAASETVPQQLVICRPGLDADTTGLLAKALSAGLSEAGRDFGEWLELKPAELAKLNRLSVGIVRMDGS